MYCKNCGKVLSADDKFCSGCGTRVPERKPAGVSEPMFFLEKREPAGDKPTEKRPKRVVHLDEFQWNLDGYPTTGRKTEDVDFDWASVLDDKAKRERPKTFAPEPEKPEEPVVEMPKTVEELLAELPKVPAEESQSEPAPQDGAEEISFDRKIKAEKPVADKPEDAKSIEQLIEEMGSSKVEEPTRLISKSQIKAESVDRFYVFSKKQAEYQAMLDQEYDKIQNSLQEKNENKTASAPEVEEKKAELPVKEKKPEAAPASTTEPKAKPAPKAEPAPEAARKPELVAVIWAKPPAGILADPQPEPMAETQPKAVAETVVAETAAPETATAQDTPAAEEMPVVEKTEDAPNPVEVAAEPVAGKPVEEASGDDIPKEGQESKEGDVSRNTIIIQRIPKEEEEKEVQEEAKETKEEKEKGEDEKKDADASAITFADIFREDEEEEESEGGSRFLKVVAIILIILVILEACILGIQHFAGDSKAAQMINNAYRQVVGLFSDKDDETPVEEREGSSEMQRIIDRQSVKNENLL